ncbi:uncharacterized protein LOC135825231 [Sycon ciliatum]|uniref:uncharacterized protein LOC135825231 n=1 Tax=Sycon ciliatum TaxID=27933 RepID=UPI0031F70360
MPDIVSYVFILLGVIPIPVVENDYKCSQEELSQETSVTNISTSEYGTELKICKAMEQESVEPVLNSVLLDVWEAAVLPLLSLADIFQLCGVTRHVRDLLHNETIFRRLCQNRYQISPNLKLSYITVAKHLYIATRVSSIHKRVSDSGNACVVHSDDPHDPHQVFNQRNSMFVQLCSLALMPTTGPAQTIMRYSLPLSKPLISLLVLPSKDTSLYLPKLSFSMIEKHCRVWQQQVWYSLEDSANLLLEMCGSYEEYQTCILKRMEQDIPETASFLKYSNRSCRQVELAKCLEIVSRSDPQLLLSLRCDSLIREPPPHINTRWSYNSSDFVIVENADSGLSDDVIATHNWINVTGELALRHSVLKLFIKGSLRLSQLEDYFVAVMAYDKLWQSLPQSSRPSRIVLYRDLGSYLLSTLPRSQREKELSKEELLNAMERCGKMIVDNATHEVRCRARISCCILM